MGTILNHTVTLCKKIYSTRSHLKKVSLPRGVKDNAEAEVERYNQILADHPVDLQILGIGRNGHIGFNEPGTPLIAKLTL